MKGNSKELTFDILYDICRTQKTISTDRVMRILTGMEKKPLGFYKEVKDISGTIPAIKQYRLDTGASLRDAAEFVRGL